MPESLREGRVVAFAAPRGGVGRSTALANAAWTIATAGHRVLVVDWDLDDPTQHEFFRPFLLDAELASTDGILDAAMDLAAEVSSSLGGQRSWSQLLDHYTVSLDWTFPGGGALDLLPAGRQTTAYALRALTFDWKRFFDSATGETFVDLLIALMRSEYDYVLIDCRRGADAAARLATLQLADAVVLCFTLAPSCVDGARRLAEGIVSERGQVELVPVPTRVEPFEKLRLDEARRYAYDALAALPSGVGEMFDLETPYVPYYTFGEVLAAFVDRPGQTGTLLAAAERLASRVSGLSLGNLSYASPEECAKVLARYRTRRPSPAGSPRLVSP